MSDADEDATDDRSSELDGLRIRQFAAARRAAYRSRSHAVIAMLVCAVAVIQAAIFLIQHLIRIGFGGRIPLYAAFIVFGAIGVAFFMRRATALHKEATATHLESPSTPPDFSTLSDGSQRWKNLEELH